MFQQNVYNESYSYKTLNHILVQLKPPVYYAGI